MIINSNENKFVELISNIPNVAVQGYNKKREVIYWNEASQHIYGYTKEEALGKKLEDLIIPNFMKDDVITFITNWYEKGEAIPSSELPLRHKDGSTVFVYSSHIMLGEDTDNPEMFCVDIDLTKQKLQEETLKQQDKQLFQQSKLVQMGEMISMIAHQWRQPLNAISATGINISLLSSMGRLKADKVQESSELIQNQCQKMSSTIDTFMNFVKPGRESTAFKLAHTVEDTLKLMGIQLINHNITVNVETINENISVIGHEDLLEQVIINLLSNARDTFDDLEQADKVINIIIDIKDNVPVITIEDNAGGIPHNIQEKIFNPYFTTKEQGKGTGIGLYMSKDIMKKSFDGGLKYKAIENGSSFDIVCGTKE